MSASEILNVRYWDVFPKKIKLSKSAMEAVIPLSIRGETAGDLVFETTNDAVAWIDAAGKVHAGLASGWAMIMIYDSQARASVRHVQVEVIEISTASTGGGY